jgi:hypothetical protein
MKELGVIGAPLLFGMRSTTHLPALRETHSGDVQFFEPGLRYSGAVAISLPESPGAR